MHTISRCSIFTVPLRTQINILLMRDTKNHDEIPLVVSPKSSETRWVALGQNDEIISEGKTPNEAIEEAKKVTEDYTLMFVPIEGKTYFF